MKKSTFIIYILTLIFSVSCSDFLNEEPPTSIYGQNFLDSKESMEAAVTDVYTKLNSVYWGNPLGTYLGNASKCRVWTGNRRTDQYEQCHYMTLYSTTSDNKNLFTAAFDGVSACNNILYYLPESSVDETYKLQIAGEIHFLRAFFYFTLVRLYGDVPIITKPVLKESDLNVARDEYQKVYRFILDDLDFAQSNMRSYSEQEAINRGASRACSSAVHAVRAMVFTWIASYMTSPYDQFFDTTKPSRYPDFTNCGVDTPDQAWEIVLQETEKLINDPESPYALESDYRNLFRWDPFEHPEDYQSKERILVTTNTPEYGPTNFITQMLWSHPAETISMSGTQSIAGRTRPARWIWEKWCEKYGNTELNSKGFHSASSDPRLAATYQYGSYDSWDQATDNIGQVKTNTGIFPETTSGTSKNHFFRKFISKRYDYNCGDADCYIIRMADIYLTAAEAAASLGQTDKAIGYVNKVLERARNSVDDLSTPSEEPADWKVSQFSSQEQLIDAIALERIFEMHGENHEWFDTHRRGARWLIRNIVKPYTESMDRTENASVKGSMELYATPTPSDVVSVRKSMICAYPDYEIRNNTALTPDSQNDFYWK